MPELPIFRVVLALGHRVRGVRGERRVGTAYGAGEHVRLKTRKPTSSSTARRRSPSSTCSSINPRCLSLTALQ